MVDDEVDVRELLEFNLRGAGFEVILADCGLTGLHRARLDSPSLIVLDVMLGDMDGFTVCELLGRQTSTSDIPVIMFTALPGELPRFNGLAAGAVHFVSKNVGPQELIAIVRDELRRHREQQVELERMSFRR